MSVAKAVLNKYGYTLFTNKGKALDLGKTRSFITEYTPIQLTEDRDYFEYYLIDNGEVFGNTFSGVFSIGMEDIKRMGFYLLSIDLRQADSKVFQDLPWFENQRRIYFLLSEKEGIPPGCNNHSRLPSDITANYDVGARLIILMGKSVSKNGYQEYKVGDD